MEHPADYDAIVIGLGPVGLLMANLLGQQGHKVLGIDKVTDSYQFPRAIHLDAEVIRIMQVAGLADELLPLLRPCPFLELNDKKFRPLFRASINFYSGYAANDFMFYQPELEALLKKGCERFPNVTLRWGTEVTGISQNASGIEVESVGLAPDRATYLIACDGAKSGVRQWLNIPQKEFGFEKGALKIDALEAGDETIDTLHVQKICSHRNPWVRMKGRGNHRRWELNYTMTMSKGEYEKPETTIKLLEEIGVDTRKLEIVHAVWYRFRGALSTKWQSGRVFLAGDAAHVTPPYIGQGMCAGFRDALNLSWKLDLVLSKTHRKELLDTYQPERLPQVKIQILLAIAIGKVFTTRLWYLLWFLSRLPLIGGLLRNIKLPLDPQGKTGIWGKGRAIRGLFPQFNMPSGQLTDHLLGKKWAMVGIGHAFSEEEIQSAEAAGLQLATLPDGGADMDFFNTWTKRKKARFYIVRPDLYVFSSGNDPIAMVREFERIFVKPYQN